MYRIFEYKIWRNFYFITGTAFLVWLLFLDSNDVVFTQWERQNRLKKLYESETFYKKRINEIQADYKELSRNPRIMEKFAREHYYFKRPKEEVFVIEETLPEQP